MNILVFDDNEFNRLSAKLTLVEHNLIIVGTYDEAEDALLQNPNELKWMEIRESILKEAGISPYFDPNPKWEPKEKIKKYWEIDEIARERAVIRVDFDVVMTDLMVPASARAQGPDGKKFIGQEMPLGTSIALLAITRGIKNVSVVTNMSHHDHPAAATFDRFKSNGYQGTGETKIPDLNIICTNHTQEVLIDEQTKKIVPWEFLKSYEGERKYPLKTKEKYTRERIGIVRAKDWGKVLKRLMGEKVE
jgi:CheY-like chemotaxis protein